MIRYFFGVYFEQFSLSPSDVNKNFNIFKIVTMLDGTPCFPTWPPQTFWKYWFFLNYSYFSTFMPRKPKKLATRLTWLSCIHFWSQKSGICYLRGFCCDVTSHENQELVQEFWENRPSTTVAQIEFKDVLLAVFLSHVDRRWSLVSMQSYWTLQYSSKVMTSQKWSFSRKLWVLFDCSEQSTWIKFTHKKYGSLVH